MNTFDLGRILEEVHWDEYAEFDNPPHHIKSLRHRLQIHRIMNQAVEKHAEPVQHTRMKLSPRKILILLVLIFTAIITAAAIVVWYGNMYGRRHSDNTELFAVVDGSPEVIEEVYELMEIPEGYELVEINGVIGDVMISKKYTNKKDGRSIIFEQSTRKDFTYHVDTERKNMEEIEIDGNKALLVQSIQYGGKWISVYYDIGDYIFTITACLPPDVTISMLKNIKLR